MIFKRFYDDNLAQASYLIACERTRDPGHTPEHLTLFVSDLVSNLACGYDSWVKSGFQVR